MVTDPIRRAKWHSSMEERIIVGLFGDRLIVGQLACVPSHCDRSGSFRVAVSTIAGKGCNLVD